MIVVALATTIIQDPPARTAAAYGSPVLLSAVLAPVFLVGGWTLAAHRQPPGYDGTRDTISALAGLGATDRWVMTAGLVGLGVCHLATALGLRGAATAGRVVLAVGGVAVLAVAAFPLPRTGSSSAHAVAALVAFGALTLWPALARVPKGLPATLVLAALLAWFGVELFTDGAHVGLSERVLAAAQALWPLCVVVITRRGTSGGRPTVTRPA
jgi:hypothetical membrane protein